MRIGKHFSLDELTRSQAAARHGIPNQPGPEALENMRTLVRVALDPLREKLGKPIIVNSCYRSPRVNQVIGGSKTSQHVFGEAADIEVHGMSSVQLVQFIVRQRIAFDQLIEEFGQWTHISVSPRNRRQVLRARKVGKRTVYEPF